MGLFNISDDHIEKYQSLDAHFIQNKASTFFFRAESAAMSPLILRNDVLIVDRSFELTPDKIIVVSIDGDMLCRRYVREPRASWLVAGNPLFKNILITPEMNLLFFGVVTGLARDLD